MKLLFPLLIASVLALRAADRININTGTVDNDGTGDKLRVAMGKVNSNFSELFSRSSTLPTNSAAWRANLQVGVEIQPQWFGALANGTADDTDAVQSAVTATEATHGALFFPPGTYKLTDTISIASGLHMRGKGATLRMTGNHPILSLASFTDGSIEGIRFETDQLGNVEPPYAVYLSSETASRIHFCNNTVVNLKTCFGNLNQFAATQTNLWIEGNTFQADFRGVNGGNLGNVLDVRGYDGLHITGNNFYCQGEMQMVKITYSVRDAFVTGNLFQSVGAGCTAGWGPCLSTFSDTRKLLIAGNVFNTIGYGDAITAKPTSSDVGITWHSEPSELLIVNNIFDHANAQTIGGPIAAMGAWGLSDQVLVRSTLLIQGNVIKEDAPVCTQPTIIAKGFTDVLIAGNIVNRTNTLDYAYNVDGSNNRNLSITGNHFDTGITIISDKQYNYTGSQYQNCPESIVYTGNTVRDCRQLACLWMTGLTNGTRSLLVSGNNLSTLDHVAALVRMDDCSITNVVVANNVGQSATPYLKVASVIANEIYTGNSWQAHVPPPWISQVGTNLVLDFANGPYQISAVSNMVYIHASNTVAGASVDLRLQSYDGDTTVYFDPLQICQLGPAVSLLKTASSTVVHFTARSDTGGTGDVTANVQSQTDPISIAGDNAYFRSYVGINGGMSVAGATTLTGALTLGSYLLMNNQQSLYGWNAAHNATVEEVNIDSANRVQIAPGGATITFGGPIHTPSGTPAITTNAVIGTATLTIVNGVIVGFAN